jgi:anti-sigma regulatory factor (Ser/Thr protein kinase)
MPTDVQYLLVNREHFALLRLQGVLDRTTADTLRGPVLAFVADQAPPTVIDVAGLRVDDPSALSTFADVARETADWPAGQPVVSVPDKPTVDWSRAGLRVMHRSEVPQAMGGEVLSADLEPVTGAARRARELVTEGCARWDVLAVAGPACIVVTELVNNVVAHAQTPMTVRLGLGHAGDALHLSVRDRSTSPPRLGPPVDTTAYGGRGLQLVDSVAERWGTSALPDGKLVWAVVPPDEPA